MKRSKIFSLGLASLLAVSMVGLVACGKSGDSGNGGGNNNPGGEDNNPGGTTELTAVVYPTLDTKTGYFLSNSDYNRAKTHDPVVVEAFLDNGTPMYYAFSTDNDGGYGVQVRQSPDLVKWYAVGAAIDGYAAQGLALSSNKLINEGTGRTWLRSGNSPINEVYNWISKGTGFDCYTLWAPDVVPATSNKEAKANGEWWLYSCWTTSFGSRRSVIFKCKANNVAGPYQYEAMIVQDNEPADGKLNEIDPSIFYSADGSRMFMSYGSFAGGFGVIELNPQTGLRLSGNVTDPGKKIVAPASGNFDAEGSAVSYFNIPVYSGNIAEEEYDETKWNDVGKYYMMGSDGALMYNYSMRTWTSDTPDGNYTSDRGTNGYQIGGTWSWQPDANARNVKELNYYIPGHNDMLTTKDGRNVIIYHTRVTEGTTDGNPSYNGGEHYLFTSLFDFNSKGQLLINPNRYAGERVGIVTAEDITSKTNGKYSVISFASADVGYTYKTPIARPVDRTFTEDGKIMNGTTEVGTWKLYGSHYVYIVLDGIEYYGTAMPAWIAQYDASASGYVKGNGGLTISALSAVENGQNHILYCNMQF